VYSNGRAVSARPFAGCFTTLEGLQYSGISPFAQPGTQWVRCRENQRGPIVRSNDRRTDENRITERLRPGRVFAKRPATPSTEKTILRKGVRSRP
jgi:hypothetical protein